MGGGKGGGAWCPEKPPRLATERKKELLAWVEAEDLCRDDEDGSHGECSSKCRIFVVEERRKTWIRKINECRWK